MSGLFITCGLAAPTVERGSWGFGVEAETDVVSIETAKETETRWRVDGAIVCVRGELELPPSIAEPASATACGSRRWSGFRIVGPEVAVVLDGPLRVTAEAGRRQPLRVALRHEGERPASWRIVDSIGASEPVSTPMHLLWSGELEGAQVVLPFSGSVTLGRDVSWSDARLLHRGKISVYSSDSSPDQRTKLDEADLLLGDSVQIGWTAADPRKEQDAAKGFVRWAPGEPMRAVAFGRARSLQIARYGGSGFSFRPGWFTRLRNSPVATFWVALIVAALAALSSLDAIVSRLLAPEDEREGEG